jgi:S-DNA-T family DNA segregation ATPase FtsK/SpoIIIE
MIGITGKNRQEVLGLLLTAFGLLLGLSLIPPHWIEGTLVDNIGSENLAGPVGEFLESHLIFLLGWGSCLIPFLVVLWGINRFLERPLIFPVRMTLLMIGGFFLYSTASVIQSADYSGAGWLAVILSSWFVRQIGLFGSLLVIYSLGIVLVILTTGLRIGPVVSRLMSLIVRVYRNLSDRVEQLGRAVVNWNRERKEQRRIEKKQQVRERLGDKPKKLQKKKEPRQVEKTVKVWTKAEPEVNIPIPEKKKSPELAVNKSGYNIPPISLLEEPPDRGARISRKDNEELAHVLIDKLSDFNIRGEVVDIVSGPVITMFELKPAPGVKVNQIQNLSDDLAMALRAQKIRIVAPIPGKDAVGIEIPNREPEQVFIREIIGSNNFEEATHSISLPLGKDIIGRPVVADLASMPHLLVAGATGAGKSVSIHCMVTGFLYRFSPDELTLIMIDPKMLELRMYNGIPHLLTPVVTDPREAVKTLRWAVREMEQRYAALAARGVRSIPEYNKRVETDEDGIQKKLPFLVIIIDELADLIITMQNEVEEPLARLAQMARGVGIHLILATQRPSVDVITGMIKANFPSRISFQVASKTDSRTILDMNGAEKLLGKGDMLFMPGGSSNPIRIHGAFISHKELENVVNFVKGQLDFCQHEDIGGTIADIKQFEEESLNVDDERDVLFNEAIKLVVRYGHGSTSLLQRRLKIGYTRAARIVDQLEAAAIVGPPDGSKAREVMVDESYLKEAGIE